MHDTGTRGEAKITMHQHLVGSVSLQKGSKLPPQKVFLNNLNRWAFSPLFKECKALHLEYRSNVSLPKTICSMKEIQTDTIPRQQRQTDLATLTGIYKQNKM